MPSIQLIKLTIRTGTEAQRRRVVLEQGELAYITDIKRVVVGDGILSGGNAISPNIHNPLQIIGSRITLANAYKGDIVYEAGLLWQLTAFDATNISSWSYIGPKTDDTLAYDTNNALGIKVNGIAGDRFAANAGSGGIVATLAYGLSANPDYTTLGVTDNQIHVLDGGISYDQINTNAVSFGLKGGSGAPLALDIDPTVFSFVGNSLGLSALPANMIKFKHIDSTLVGNGLVYDVGSSSIRSSINAVNATMSLLSGTIGLKVITASVNRPFAAIQYDDYGRITSSSSSITTTFALSARPGTPNYGQLSAHNGYPGQGIYGALTGVPLSMFQVISSNRAGTLSTMIMLSSAGFIALANDSAQDTKSCGRFAIPVFTY